MESMVHYFLIISDSIGKHAEHGNSLFSLLQTAWKSMGSKVQHFLWKRWGAWGPLFHELR